MQFNGNDDGDDDDDYIANNLNTLGSNVIRAATVMQSARHSWVAVICTETDVNSHPPSKTLARNIPHKPLSAKKQTSTIASYRLNERHVSKDILDGGCVNPRLT
uniref:Uncharacterized protein n=1 Tax=Glossina austeni TaxID=7395 RepID=A0A1A9UYV4_GLOAU